MNVEEKHTELISEKTRRVYIQSNTCHTKMRQYSENPHIQRSLSVFQWTPHTEPDCSMCRNFNGFESRGRLPKATKNRGRPRKGTLAQQLHETGHRSWGDCMPLSPSRFLPPAQNIALTDLLCKKCMCVADRHVTTPCDRLFCYICIMNSEDGTYACCEEQHDTGPKPASASSLVTQMIGSLLVHCSVCNTTTQLQNIKEHMDSRCKVVSYPSPSKLTVGQLLTQSPDTPPTVYRQLLYVWSITSVARTHLYILTTTLS